MVWLIRDTNTWSNRGEHATLYTINVLVYVFVSRLSQTIDYKRGVNGSMLFSRLLNDVFVSRVSQTRDYKRGVNGSMLSSRLLNATIYSTFIVYGLTHTGHEHMI
jgi:hypothetical protein